MTFLTIKIRIDKLTDGKFEPSFDVLSNNEGGSNAVLKNYFTAERFNTKLEALNYIKKEISRYLKDYPEEYTRIKIEEPDLDTSNP